LEESNLLNIADCGQSSFFVQCRELLCGLSYTGTLPPNCSCIVFQW